MIAAASSQTGIPASEFVIYSFKKDELSKGSPVWHRQMSVGNENEAIEWAEELYASRHYMRIEVRRRELDAATGLWQDESVHVVGKNSAKVRKMILLSFAAVTCVVAAGFITAFNI